MNLATLRTLYQVNLAAVAVILFALLPPVVAGGTAIVVICAFWSLFAAIVHSAQKIIRLDVNHDITWEPDDRRRED